MLSKMHSRSSMNVEELSQAPTMLYHMAIRLIRAGQKLEIQDVR